VEGNIGTVVKKLVWLNSTNNKPLFTRKSLVTQEAKAAVELSGKSSSSFFYVSSAISSRV
jgi:hypothetical protein